MELSAVEVKWATADVLRQRWSRVASGPQRTYRDEVEVHHGELVVLHMGFDPHDCLAALDLLFHLQDVVP